MALFKKKTKEVEKQAPPKLPSLPRIPDIPSPNKQSEEPMPKLPSYPSNSLGNKFSQNTIKEAVTGGKEEKSAEEPDFTEEEKIPRPISKPFIKARKDPTEPVFIRIDKFESGLHTFEKARKQISEIEEILSDIKKVRADEERQLSSWEREIQNVKKEIKKIDQDIFSKVD